MATTTVTVTKWGNSSGIRIPSQMMRQINLSDGDEVNIMVTDDNRLLIWPTHQEDTPEILREHLDMLLSQIKPGKKQHEEVDLGVRGRELI
ncbi:AbrB/MazE/SpoVT family DNA-binding domain-containing protein [Gorillibacterium sp. sgz500922]|uniref:AbrB/MazE/SpoVT family DNA-binding domain-containing protein n=1 Tax=Gorillibacterium sp. sgz500922 TaxID=3446694 RepID=UPI003F66FC03